MANNWTREQTIIALSVYCKIPFNKASNTNPEIVKAASLIGRTPVAVKMKVGNFGSFDPELKARGIVGLSNTSKLDEMIWNEYSQDWSKLAFDSEKIIAKLKNKTLEDVIGLEKSKLPEGEERERMVKQRINQIFFRNTVLASYDYRCCITGVENPILLEACHIVSWSQDKTNRTNPQNGLCMNPFFHKAYDNYLIGITPDMQIQVSEELLQNTSDDTFMNYLSGLNGKKIIMPNKFYPNKDLLAMHYEQYSCRDKG